MTSTSSPPSSSSSLQRGRACVSCRRRKMRCDGQRPVCGQCQRANRSDDCEYTDGQGRTRTQMLEENIARLEARIQELEHPEDASQSVNLFNPYSYLSQPPSSIAASHVPNPDFGEARFPSTSARSSPVASSSASSSSSHPLSASASPQPSALVSSVLSSSEISEPWWAADEPPARIAQQLVNLFLPHASTFGFFLNIPRFRNAAFLPVPLGHHYRPSTAILSTVYLWGIHISQSDYLLAQEPLFLARAIQQTAQSLSGNHPQKVLHAIQAEILLTHYLFNKGRFLEGKYHCSAAVSLAVNCGLHRIRTDQPPESVFDFIGNAGFELPAPRDSVEEGEMINGFWAVFALDKCWSVALGIPSMGFPASQIDTPWPLDMTDYEQGLLLPDLRGHATLDRFMQDPDHIAGADSSDFTSYVKAAFLFERASQLAARWKPNMHRVDADAYYAEFMSLESFIDKFILTLPPIDTDSVAPAAVRSLVVTHTLARVSTIQLHRIFSQTDAASNTQCLEAATIITRLMNIPGLSLLNPLMGTLWTSICFVFISEILRLRAYRTSWAPSTPSSPGEDAYTATLDRAIAAMARFSQSCPLMRYQFTRVQEAYAAL